MSLAAFMPAQVHAFVTTRIRAHLPEIIGSVSTSGAALMSWQVHAQWALSVIASLAAIVVAFFTVRSLIRKDRAGK